MEHIIVVFTDKSIKGVIIALFHFSDQEKIYVHKILLSRRLKFKTFIPFYQV